MKNSIFIMTIALSFNSFAQSPANRCDDFAVGEIRVISTNAGVGAHYTIQRDTPQDYSIYINVHFSQEESFVKERLQICLGGTDAVGLSSADARIHLKLYDKYQSPVPAPKAIKIKVKDDVERENSHLYSPYTQCRVYVHELLHLAGLVDEYNETSIAVSHSLFGLKFYSDKGAENGKPAAYDCRSQSDSIMGSGEVRDPTKKQFRLLGGHYLICACSNLSTPEACKAKLEDLAEASHHQKVSECGEGLDTLKGDFMSGIIYPPGKDQKDYSTFYSVVPYAPQVFPLSPAHVRRLIWPECPERNKLYELCTANVHRTSREHHGKGCLPAPPECAAASSWLN